MVRPFTSFGVACLCFAAAGVRAPAQEPARAGGDQPVATFRAGVDLVAVDVSVIDRRGRPVRDLEPDDFALTVNGAPRRLVSAQFISQTTLIPPPRQPTHYSSNAHAAGGRLVMLAVDRGNIGTGEGRQALRAAGRFIDRLGPADRVGLAVLPGGGPTIDFTANHALVRTMLERVTGSAARPLGRYQIGVSEALALARGDMRVWGEAVTRECASEVPLPLDPLARTEGVGEGGIGVRRQCETSVAAEARMIRALTRQQTSASLLSLRALIERLALSPGPKTIVLLSEGLVVEEDLEELDWIGTAAAAAQVSLYVLRLEGPLVDASVDRLSPTLAGDRHLKIHGLEALAGRARGTVFTVASGADPVFERLAWELSGYYLLSFEPDPADRDGRRHAIRVEVRRPGVEVRARREFRVEPEPAARTIEEALAEVLRAPLMAADLELRATAYTLRAAASGKLRILLAAEVDGAEASSSVSLGYALFDERRRLVASDFPAPDGGAARADGPQHYLAAAVADPGVYTLKVAAIDERGRRGSVEHTFEARLASAGQIRLGDLVLADAPGTGEPPRPSVGGATRGDSLVAYLELYSAAADQLRDAQVRVELAEREDGPAIETAAARFDRTREQADGLAAEARLPIAMLPAGDYVARAVVSVRGRPAGRVSRPFRVARTPGAPLPAGEAIPSIAGASSVSMDARFSTFHRNRVLEADVVRFFLDRLSGGPRAGAAAAALEEARRGRVEGLAARLAGADEEDDPLVPFLRGLDRLSGGALEEAAAEFRLALSRSPDFLAAVFYLGACYAAGGRDREAAGAWQMALVTEEEAPFIYLVLVDALLRLDDGALAVEVAQEAAALWPDNDAMTLRLGAAYLVAGHRDRAVDVLDPYVERHPDDHATSFLLLRAMYEAHAAGRPIETGEKDRERFARYARAYEEAGGPQSALVQQWQKVVFR